MTIGLKDKFGLSWYVYLSYQQECSNVLIVVSQRLVNAGTVREAVEGNNYISYMIEGSLRIPQPAHANRSTWPVP